MPGEHVHPVLSFIRRIAAAGGIRRAADGQLLGRFAAHQDQAAFAALVQRHGPMVLGVCQRVLHNHHDAEDAFQATFLVLARKAGSVGKPEQLGNWLYGVAYRTALEARTRRARRLAKERQAVTSETAEPFADAAWAEIRQVLDEEIARLPSRYRWPFVLCCLEGKTNEEAAQTIGCPQGTVCSRLAWARQRLRNRLTRRGLGLSAGLLATVLSQKVSLAGAPPALAASTVKAAMTFAAKPTVACAISSEVAALTHGVLTTMQWAKAKVLVGLVLVAAALLGAGTGLLALWSEGTQQQEAKIKSNPGLVGQAAHVDLPPPGENEAERLYRALEKKVRSAESLRLVCEMDAQFDFSGQSNKLRGSGLLATGNKARFEFENGANGPAFKMLMVSDGKQFVVGMPRGFQPRPQPTNANLREALSALVVRGGFLPAALGFGDLKGATDGLDIDVKLAVGDFKLGAKEFVANRETQIIEYALTFEGGDKATMKLWLDPQTLLPLKRHFVPQDKLKVGVTEVYTEFVLGPQMDASVFELPQ